MSMYKATIQKTVFTLTALALGMGLFAVVMGTQFAQAASSLFGGAVETSGHVVLVSDGSNIPTGDDYSGIDFDDADGTVFSTLSTLSSDFNVTDDSCGGGSPRFQIAMDTNGDSSSDGNIFVYMGPSPSFSGCSGSANTGNLIGNNDAGRWDFTQLGGPLGGYSDAPANVLSGTILGINIVVDSSWSAAATGGDSEQTVNIDNVVINSTTYEFTEEPETVTVTIDKYIEGEQATAASANSASFPMQTTYSADNIGSGTNVPFSIGPTGYNSPNPYEAITSEMSSGANYQVNEVTGGDTVGASCEAGKPFALAGYTWGDTLEEAQEGTPTSTAPNLTNITNDKFVIVWNEDCELEPEEPDTVQVTIIKYIDGQHATGANAASSTFPFIAEYDGTVNESPVVGSSPYDIGPVGNNTPNSYEAATLNFDQGADYGTHEVTSGDTVGTSCEAGKPFALTGYSWGSSEAAAINMGSAGNHTPTTTAPSFTDLQHDMFVIVWNEDCEPLPGPATLTIVKHTDEGDGTFNFTVTGATATSTSLTTSNGSATSSSIQLVAGTSTVSELASPGWDFTDSSCVYGGQSIGIQTLGGEEIFVEDGDHVTCTFTNTMIQTPQENLKVHIYKYLQNASSTTQVPDNSTLAPFPMESSWSALNIGTGSGSYVLGNYHGGAVLRYAADTSSMSSPANYSTHEVTTSMASSSQVIAAGGQCATGKFRLVGYKTGTSLAGAQAAAVSTSTPTFVGITSDRYVIVINEACNTISGDVVGDNGVLEVTSIDSVDTSATANNTYENGWEYLFHITVPTDEPGIAMKFSDWTSGSNTIPAANNMRISSAQASSTSTITVLAADTYTVPNLQMITDLNPSLPGIQVEVKVEVKIPTVTSNGSYSTTYGVRSE